MNKIASTEWYTLQPKSPHQFYGTTTDWNETIWVKINQSNATLVQNALKNLRDGDDEVPAKTNPKRKLIIASNLVELFTSLESYDSIIERYNVAFSKTIENNLINMIDGEDYVEIKVINDHRPNFVNR
jgi:hypothetical protein